MLDSLFEEVSPFNHPPIDRWSPDIVVDIEIYIDAEANWYYQGSRIERRRMVKLFSTLLKLASDGCYYLITPNVKYRIRVDDVPFGAVELNCQGDGVAQKLYFRTNVDEVVLAGTQHPITVSHSPQCDQIIPYLTVKSGLRARISRPVYYELAELITTAEDDSACSQQGIGVFSDGVFFPMDSLTVNG